MEIGNQASSSQGKRFDKATYAAATRKEIDATPLLEALESCRVVSCGVMSLLSVLRNHGLPELNCEDAPTLITNVQTDELLSFCIESMCLLNSRIESLADFMSMRNESV